MLGIIESSSDVDKSSKDSEVNLKNWDINWEDWDVGWEDWKNDEPDIIERSGAATKWGQPQEKSALPSITPRRKAFVNRTTMAISRYPLLVAPREEFVFFAYRYLLGVMRIVLWLLRVPIAIMLFFWILSFIVGRITNNLLDAASPICIVPVISTISFCHPQQNLAPLAQEQQQKNAPDFSKLMAIQSDSYEQLLGESAGGPALSLELRRAQMATRDLALLVRHSDLDAKEILSALLSDISNGAKTTAERLGKFTAKVGGSVDNIMAANEWTLTRIENARMSQQRSFSLWLLQDTLRLMDPEPKDLRVVIASSFEEAMDILSKQMNALLIEASKIFQDLYNLEESLSTLHGVIHREDVSQSMARDDLLAELWTMFGGNRNKIRNFDSNLALLKELGRYRKDAMAHVVGTLVALGNLRDALEDLRERVVAPNLIGANVPAEVHIKSIKLGLERLRIGRMNAKKKEIDEFKEASFNHGLSISGW